MAGISHVEILRGKLTLRNDISRIRLKGSSTPELNIVYDDYEEFDNRLAPEKNEIRIA